MRRTKQILSQIRPARDTAQQRHPPTQAILIANRGEIACRIIATCKMMGFTTIAIYSQDDQNALHRYRADQAFLLDGKGSAAFLNIQNIIGIARSSRADMIHPGYGFLSENPLFAQACADADITFIGPSANALSLLGDKVSAHSLARSCNVPTPLVSKHNSTVADIERFFTETNQSRPIIIKAQNGGGGRGQAVCAQLQEIAPAFKRCASEALAAFGDGSLYAEQFIADAKHVEIQIAGDGVGGVVGFVERDCSIQRKRQKIIEFTPCLTITPDNRSRMIACAKSIAQKISYAGLCTFEFLLYSSSSSNEREESFVFIEANPRLQVEHTVTEELFSIDLVQAQICLTGLKQRIAQVFSPQLLAISEIPPTPTSFAMQLRVNMERVSADGSVRSTAGPVLNCFETPTGRCIRVDTLAYTGYPTFCCNQFDSLIAKVIVKSDIGFAALCKLARSSLQAFRTGNLDTNIPLLDRILAHAEFVGGTTTTVWFDAHLPSLVAVDVLDGSGSHNSSLPPLPSHELGPPSSSSSAAAAVAAVSNAVAAEGTVAIPSTMAATIVEVAVEEGQVVKEGQVLVVVSAMKMEHVILCELPEGIVVSFAIPSKLHRWNGKPLLLLRPSSEDKPSSASAAAAAHLTTTASVGIRGDLQEVFDRNKFLTDDSRADKVHKRHMKNMLTARENIANLVDNSSTFTEYGGLVVAAQRARRSMDDLIANTPADGMITGIASRSQQRSEDDGIGSVNGERTAVLAYDFLVLAGTQGSFNHRKKDRMFEIAAHAKLPVVIFCEGGGGRPGDVDVTGISGLDCMAFHLFGKLNGVVPVVGIVAGKCFAGNAALLGCCDVIIACKDSNIGMGGPAMIEGGGLGRFQPEAIGPNVVQLANGVIDIEGINELQATAVARQYLDLFQHPLPLKPPLSYEPGASQLLLREIIPENRLRVFDVRRIIHIVCDKDSGVIEIRRDFGLGMVCCLGRIGGYAVAIVANNCQVLSGAITADNCDKAARFMQLADAFDIPIIFFCDTPGFIVGPNEEKNALVRKAGRLFINGSALTVPYFTIVLRKSYGLGAQAMAGGSQKAPSYIASWPSGEFGGMGLEGAIKLGFRKELESIEDLREREETYQGLVQAAYHRGKALNVATMFEIDNVIDPAETRNVLIAALQSSVKMGNDKHYSVREKKKRMVDSW